MCYLFELWHCVVFAILHFKKWWHKFVLWICTQGAWILIQQRLFSLIFLRRGLQYVPCMCVHVCLFLFSICINVCHAICFCMSVHLLVCVWVVTYTNFNEFHWDLNQMNPEYQVRPTGMRHRLSGHLFRSLTPLKCSKW